MPSTVFVKGRWVGICDRCGKKFYNTDLKKDWQGLYLCKDDWETRQPQDFLRGRKDDPSVAWTRPEQPDVEQSRDGWIAVDSVPSGNFPGDL